MGIMELYERHGVSNQYQLDYFFNSLFILTALETKKARIAGPLCLCADRGGLPAQRDINVEIISKAWRHYEKRNEKCFRKENKDKIFGKITKYQWRFAVSTWTSNYSDFTWASWRHKSSGKRLFVQQLVHANKKGDRITVCVANPLWGETTNDRWILLTKG